MSSITGRHIKLQGLPYWEPFYFLQTMKDSVTLDLDQLTDLYEYARDQYKFAIGDRDRDYWEGFLEALDAVYTSQPTS